jgi:hypothetical protein
MAGCRPEYFPVVLAVVEAACDPVFNLHGQSGTTNAASPLIIINGPIRQTLEVNCAAGVFGPGFRANATIGRTLRLVMINLGGTRAGQISMSTMGHPGRYTYCIGEYEEASPWEPLHVERGFSLDVSTVTLFAGDAPLSISDHRSRTPKELAATLAWAAAGHWSPFWWPMDDTSLYVLCPEHAMLFAAARWSKDRVRSAMFDAVQRPAGELRRGETTAFVQGSADGALVRKWTDPERIAIVVAGGEAGRFSAVFGPCDGMQTQAVTKEIQWST